MAHSLLEGLRQPSVASEPDVHTAVQLFKALDAEVAMLIQRNIGFLEQEPAWGLLDSMQKRAKSHTAACIVLISNSHFASAEALCRTAIESTVNLYYCSGGDSVETVLSYFKSYVVTERKQNQLWRTSILGSEWPGDAKAHHLELIKDKDEVLGAYERILGETFCQVGFSYAKASEVWPSIFDRFKAINKEIDYRTIYAALCSQAHNDPEDLLNSFACEVTQVAGAGKAQEIENEGFAKYMVLVALAFLIESTAVYLAKYLSDSNEKLLPLLTSAWTAVDQVTQRVPEGIRSTLSGATR
jgi:hypothetical protein